MIKQQHHHSTQKFPGLGGWWLLDPGVGWQSLVRHTHVILRAYAEVPELVLQCIVLSSVLDKVGTILLCAAQLWPVRHTFVLCGQKGQGEDGQKAGERKSRAMVEREKGHLQTATYPAFFYLPCCHHNNARVLLPHHLPQIIDCGIQAALAGNVGLGALVWADQGVLSADRGGSGELQ